MKAGGQVAGKAAADGAMSTSAVDGDGGGPHGSPSSSSVRRVPLKTILQNFLNHVETLEAQKNEGENTYEKEFQVRTSCFGKRAMNFGRRHHNIMFISLLRS